MSWKSVVLSVLSILLFVGVVFTIVFFFKLFWIAGIAGIVLMIFPEILRRKASSEASGVVDKVIAKFVVRVLFVILALLSILAIGFWIRL